MSEENPHRPVLYNEVIKFLEPRREGYFVDGTLGAGGHAKGILEASSPEDSCWDWMLTLRHSR